MQRLEQHAQAQGAIKAVLAMRFDSGELMRRIPTKSWPMQARPSCSLPHKAEPHVARLTVSPPRARHRPPSASRACVFHRFAHHPLCDRYASEMLDPTLGRRARVCRGCSVRGAWDVGWRARRVAHAPVVEHIIRWGRSCARCAAQLSRVAFAQGARTRSGHGVGKLRRRWRPVVGRTRAAGAGAEPAGFRRHFFPVDVRRRGPNRSPCQTCPERLDALRTCSGLRPIVQRERAFRRLAQRYIDAAVTSR